MVCTYLIGVLKDSVVTHFMFFLCKLRFSLALGFRFCCLPTFSSSHNLSVATLFFFEQIGVPVDDITRVPSQQPKHRDTRGPALAQTRARDTTNQWVAHIQQRNSTVVASKTNILVRTSPRESFRWP